MMKNKSVMYAPFPGMGTAEAVNQFDEKTLRRLKKAMERVRELNGELKKKV